MSRDPSRRRREKPFASLLESIAGAEIVGDPHVRVTGLAYDSRRVEPGDAFICVRGERADGHSFAAEAARAGAVALVVESGRSARLAPPEGGALALVPDTRAAMAVIARTFYEDPSARLALAGVTGTNGKTTTALMLDSIFRAAGSTSGLIGTLEYWVGDHRMRAARTTPEAIDLQRLLAEMVEIGVTHAAMEVSSHALSLHRVDGCRFAAAVFTNLTPEHLDFHPDMDDYLAAKRRLFEDPQYLAEGRERVNAVNLDDEAGGVIAERALGKTLTYGLSPEADCRAEDVELGPDGTQFAVTHPGGSTKLRMSLVAEFNVYNALAAFTTATGLGFDPETVAAALQGMPPVPGRFERVAGRSRTVLVDYAHSPDALRRALEAARRLAGGRLVVVFGCGGDRDHTKRPVMGELATRLADRCVVTSDNPRSERPDAIIDEILAGISPEVREHCAVQPDRAEAIRMAIREAAPDDLVLIAGKGHEDYQILADRTIHFDDREVARAAIEEVEGAGDA